MQIPVYAHEPIICEFVLSEFDISRSDTLCLYLFSGIINLVVALWNRVYNVYTVDSRYLELEYIEFCEARSVYLNQKYILIVFSNHNLALDTFLQVQITRSAKLVKKSPINFEISRFDCMTILELETNRLEQRSGPT